VSDAYCGRASQSKPGGAWLQLLVSGLVVYVIAAAAGLVLVMFPDATRQVFGNIKQAILQYAPQKSKSRLPVIEPPVVAEKPSVATKPIRRPVRVRPVPTAPKGSFGVQIINATQPESPVRNARAVMVSIDDDQPVQTASTPPRPSGTPAQ
jgi:hypothetical protein